VFIADGGGGGTSPTPSYSGTQQTLSLDLAAIPAALEAFRVARERVKNKLKELGSLDIRPWAGDEVSRLTAVQFAQRSYSGAESAFDCLRGYYQQLDNVVVSLENAQREYLGMDSDNQIRMSS
jgi:hypothetical protein